MLRGVRIFLGLAILGSVVGSRFVIGQSVSDEASNTGANNSSQRQPIVISDTELQTQETIERIPTTTSADIQAVIDSFISEHDADIGIAVRALDGSFEASYMEQGQFDAASLYKTLGAYKVLQRVDAGDLSLSQPTSAGATLEECIEKAITVSDNPCGIVLQDLANPYLTDLEANDWGYEQTTLSGYFPKSSPIDQTDLFMDIYRGSRLSATSQALLLDALANQRVLNRTPDYGNATMYLKTGDIKNAVHSSALIEAPNITYAISIFTDNWNESLLSKYSAISDIHEAIHKAITQDERPQ